MRFETVWQTTDTILGISISQSIFVISRHTQDKGASAYHSGYHLHIWPAAPGWEVKMASGQFYFSHLYWEGRGGEGLTTWWPLVTAITNTVWGGQRSSLSSPPPRTMSHWCSHIRYSLLTSLTLSSPLTLTISLHKNEILEKAARTLSVHAVQRIKKSRAEGIKFYLNENI